MPGQSTTGQMDLSLSFERRIFQVSELNTAVQRLFEGEFRNIWIAGEISGCRAAASGHFYFSLKDEQSQLKCVLFKGAARFVRFRPQDGLAVLVRGNLEVYEARGEYQLVVELLEPQGAGALQLAFEQLKKKLAAEGLFDQARKKPLPKFPRRVGIITSPTGAVIRDILQVLERRFPGMHVRLFPAQVQGEGSIEQICSGLQHFSDGLWAEVVILARGGGSLADLWTFNEEAIARAIAASTVPVVSAVGHETDFSIADFVADLRAPTPSAAAEILICTKESLLEEISARQAQILQAIRYRLLLCSRGIHERGTDRAATLIHRAIVRRAQGVDELDNQLRQRLRDLLAQHFTQLADFNRRLQAGDLRLKLARSRHQHDWLAESAAKAIQTRLWQARRAYDSLHLHLGQLSPIAILSRGYSIVENSHRQVLRSAAETSPGDDIRIRLHHGQVEAKVITTRDEN